MTGLGKLAGNLALVAATALVAAGALALSARGGHGRGRGVMRGVDRGPSRRTRAALTTEHPGGGWPWCRHVPPGRGRRHAADASNRQARLDVVALRPWVSLFRDLSQRWLYRQGLQPSRLT